MKRIVMGLLGGILFLTACGQTISATPTSPISVDYVRLAKRSAFSPQLSVKSQGLSAGC
jgi:hypothetical protein